jgi:hypothetical protein
LDLAPDSAPGAISSSLFFAVEILPELEIFPPYLFIGDDEVQGSWSRKVTVRTHKPGVDALSVRIRKPGLSDAVAVSQSRIDKQTFVVSFSSKRRSESVSGEKMLIDIGSTNGGKQPLTVYFGSVAFTK